MAFVFMLIVSIAGCTADASHGASGAADSFFQKECQERACQSTSLDVEFAKEEAVVSLLQTQVKRSTSVDHGVDETEMKSAKKEVLVNDMDGVTLQAVLMNDTDRAAQRAVRHFDEDRHYSEHNSLVSGVISHFCEMKLLRFNSLHNQSFSDLIQQGGLRKPDPYFPPKLSSIEGSDGQCGDTAQGVKEACKKFNTWHTFEEVASQLGVLYRVIGPNGPHFDDIQQGGLGNCYFLAALAAVAYNQPQLIDDMFVERDLWEKDVFKTRWLLNGKESILAVDNMIPAGDANTYFTHPSPTGEFWPVILAKTWAKIYGSFRGVEGGDAASVIKAITRAPGQYLFVAQQSQDSLWEMLLDAATNKYPMSAGTCGSCPNPGRYGLHSGHAYAILQAGISKVYGEVVKVYNPWGTQTYNGAIPPIAGDKPGVFTMKYTEFYEAFDAITVNYVTPGYEVSSKSIVPGRVNAEDVILPGPGKFWVSIVWPSRRMIEPCEYLNPTCSIQGELTTEKGKQAGTMLKRMADDNDFVAMFENKAGGNYSILAEANFRESASWLDTVSFTVYAPAAVQINDTLGGSKAVALEMFGPIKDGEVCDVITLPDTGVFVLDRTRVATHNIPTYWRLDNSSLLYFVPHLDQWWFVGAKYYPQIQEGELWTTGKYSKTAFKCECEDAASGVAGFGAAIPCEQATDTNYIYGNVKCTQAQYSSYVQRYCPKTCGVCPG